MFQMKQLIMKSTLPLLVLEQLLLVQIHRSHTSEEKKTQEAQRIQFISLDMLSLLELQLQDHQLKVMFYRKQVIQLVLLIQRLQPHR